MLFGDSEGTFEPKMRMVIFAEKPRGSAGGGGLGGGFGGGGGGAGGEGGGGDGGGAKLTPKLPTAPPQGSNHLSV